MGQFQLSKGQLIPGRQQDLIHSQTHAKRRITPFRIMYIM